MRNTAAFSIRMVKSCIVSWSRCSTTSPGLMNICIHLPMKSPGESGWILSIKARMPPHWAWPSTTMCFTFSTLTAYSSAAETPCAPLSG